ncbi:hypothetical protein, partial [Dysgonomonas mossii]|uniref:hypothetical protein n=1 Tax=Dysgonomonas mossii TaxID=163665 RepID=UPI001AC7DCB2
VGTKWYFTKRELKEYIAATTTNLGLVKKSASLTAAQPSATAPVAYDAAYIKLLRDRIEDLIQKLKDAGIQA